MPGKQGGHAGVPGQVVGDYHTNLTPCWLPGKAI
jgi:hypothetical protein